MLPLFSTIVKVREKTYLRDYLISLDVDHFDIKTLRIARLFVPPNIRRQGHATKAMNNLCNYCDENNLILTLEPLPYDQLIISTDELINFYEKFDFKLEPMSMTREPK